MKIKYFFLAVILFLFITPLIYAACTITLDKSDYIAGETATLAISCSASGEKNTPYNVNWTNSSGYQFELDYGTTPTIKNQLFYQTYIIPTNWPNSVFLNVSINGTGIIPANNGTANVTSTGISASTLLITNHSFGGGYIGLVSSIKATVKDENDKKISGGFCKISGWSNDETSMLMYQDTVMVYGEVKVANILPITRFSEGTDYAYKILCYCGSAGSGTECIDEDGINVNNSVGSTKDFFTTNTWLATSVSTDLRTMELKQTNTVSVNVTNNVENIRVPIEITYDCRIDQDNNYTRRIRGPFYFPECGTHGQCTTNRGISANTTQEQGIDFIVEEHPFLQGRTTTAYCSTKVNIIDIISGKMTYTTTTSAFNITSDELNLKPDWQWISDTRLNSIVNLSTTNFDDYNGTVMGNIDLQLHNDFKAIDIIHAIELLNLISNITISNTTDNLTKSVDYEIEFTEEDNIEIEIRNVNLSKYSGNAWWNITLDFYDLGLREVEALEGIENKTGTFHLDVNCPSTGTIGSDMDCIITAYVEASQIMQKEVDFTCHISDGVLTYSSVNFNQMITKSAVSLSRAFTVPSTFTDGRSYVLQCHGDYYNLGSRRDSFYDTFIATTVIGGWGSSSSSAGITGEAIDEEKEEEREEGEIKKKIEDIIKKINPFNPETNPLFIIVEAILLLGIIALLIIFIKRKKKCTPRQKVYHRETFQTIFKSTFILIGISAGIALIAYIYKNIKSVSMNTSFLQDPLIRDLILIGAIVGLAIVLFKSLHIRGNIEFGRDPHRPKFNHDSKISKIQKRLNRFVLNDELRRKRQSIKNSRIRKFRIKKKK